MEVEGALEEFSALRGTFIHGWVNFHATRCSKSNDNNRNISIILAIELSFTLAPNSAVGEADA